MRILLKAQVPVEVGNAKAKDGSLGRDIQRILEAQKPEAAYFIEEDGLRTAVIVVDLADESAIPAIAEPWFIAFNARVTFHPAMVGEDLAKAGPAIAEAAKNFGYIRVSQIA